MMTYILSLPRSLQLLFWKIIITFKGLLKYTGTNQNEKSDDLTYRERSGAETPSRPAGRTKSFGETRSVSAGCSVHQWILGHRILIKHHLAVSHSNYKLQ